VAKYGMVIDITKCNGCFNCFLACRDEYCGNDFPPYSASQPMTGQSWMQIIEKERGKYPKVKVAYTPVPCMHCDDASCIKAATEGAIYKRADGIVIIDPKKSQGQKGLVSACPYRVIFWNEEKQIPQKCTFCAHLLDQGWKAPRCVEVCPTGALTFGNLDDANSGVARRMKSGNVEVLHPEYGLKEKVTYIGLPKRFIAGAVVFGDTDECGEGAKVTLQGKGEKRVTKTDNYGDFEFEGLKADKAYRVKVESAGYGPYEIEVNTKVDVYLGDIVLAKTVRTKKTNTKNAKTKKTKTKTPKAKKR
jgi:Fe-S-cluster-containing dehydrogenase component